MTQFDLTMHAMKTAAQMGSINRFCVTILTINRIEELFPEVSSLLEEFNISGGYHFTLADTKISKCIGDREISKNTLLKTRSMSSDLNKITKENGILIITQSKFTLVANIDGLAEHDIDLLIDNLAIFCDVVQNWAMRMEEIMTHRVVTDQQKIKTIGNLEKFKECLECSSFQLQECNEQLNVDVISRLAMLFPVLGLDANQENRILELFEKCTDEFGEFVSKQVIFNGEITELLMKASRQLEPEDGVTNARH